MASFREIREFIPGLTECRFKEARLHILKHGRGSAAPLNKSPRMTFITSSHVIQDLPFGQGYLRLANGQILETPNVIRTMIPQRIIEQYIQFCKESNMRPLSPSTISRMLCVCSATVRKSLQGLDYIAADGAKAFDDLATVAVNLGSHGRDREWVDCCERALKAGKQYIKTDHDYKVNGFNVRFVCCNALSSSRKQTSSVQWTSIIPIPNVYG